MKPRFVAKKERGMTMMSWMIVLAIAVFFMLIGIKMVPTYLENMSVQHVLDNMRDDRATRSMSPAEMKNSFIKRLKINSVYDFQRDAIKIKKEQFGTSFSVDYEVRKPVAGNVEILMSFSNSTVIPPP